jgi:hypothetical protein
MAQPQGSYPRLNAAMVTSGQFSGSIVSLVGKFVSNAAADGTVDFQCADGASVKLSVEHAELPPMDVTDAPVVEVVGQVMENNLVAVRSLDYWSVRVL